VLGKKFEQLGTSGDNSHLMDDLASMNTYKFEDQIQVDMESA